ncbi:helix-turn-helix domain-containing protein [Dyadobacter subterraneus]|uniref:Helix-turn-helix transcriptional regulator n=1 Tax=Dyadobacter subterraneus TaxID=2773304 RepID=A0ABR9W8F9_9BACT|nr:AraC family transcriptional regulator [Dyadobacter subterraneus]MBE9461756.1 helix-turn-helix transcriptional regulator [Dyadobacter subterraneus]
MKNHSISRSTFSLLNVDYVKLNKSWNYRNVISPFYRLYFIDDGFGKLYQAGKTIILEKDFLYLVPSFTLCNYQCPEYLSQYYIHFLEEAPDGTSLFSSHKNIIKIPAGPSDLEHLKKILKLNPDRDLKRSYNPKDYQKQPVIQHSQALNNDLPISAFLETKGILLQLLSRFLTPEYYNISDSKVIPSKVLETINYINTNLGENLTVKDLAEKARQNPDYFSRIFQDHTGARPLPYIQQKRIEKAQFLILTTDLSLSQIASETGFESLSYFSRIFKNMTGQTPGNYAKNNYNI